MKKMVELRKFLSVQYFKRVVKRRWLFYFLFFYVGNPTFQIQWFAHFARRYERRGGGGYHLAWVWPSHSLQLIQMAQARATIVRAIERAQALDPIALSFFGLVEIYFWVGGNSIQLQRQLGTGGDTPIGSKQCQDLVERLSIGPFQLMLHNECGFSNYVFLLTRTL